MKWSIAGLLLLGIGAAVAASVLVAALKADGPAVASTFLTPGDVQIVVAAKPMPAMTVVDAKSVTTMTVPANAAPKGHFRSPVEVVGKMIATTFVEGQPFTESCFTVNRYPLPLGMRGKSLFLTRSEAGLVNPGDIVDVLFSYTRPAIDASQREERVAMTLLQSIQVLAVNDRSVVSERESGAEPTAPQFDNKPVMVTLTVNSSQTKALQLAEKNGSLSLAVRNPLDVTAVDTDKISIRDFEPIPGDEYSKLREALADRMAPEAKGPAAEGQSRTSHPTQAGQDTRVDRSGEDHAVWVNAGREQPGEDKAQLPARMLVGQQVDPKWETMVNRSGETEELVFRRSKESWPERADDAIPWVLERRVRFGTSSNTK